MRSVVLSVVEGKNFILGTFDTTTFQTWWKSEPFPGNVDIIQKPIHVYGQYHVCIVKLVNGTYSIYRTTNMGKTWVSVYNTPNIIYTVTAIDYGWIVGSTSTGWIESKLDSGFTWSVISSFAPGCKTVINVSDDVLFAHDGTKVWRSQDYAKTWSVVLNQASWYSKPLHEGWAGKTFSRVGYSYPALAGINETIFVGFGPYLIISDDLGTTWTTHPSGWNNSIFNEPTWGNASFSPQANNQIMQIILTSGLGFPTANSKIMLRNLVGNTIHYMYSGPYAQYSSGWYWQNVFSNTNNATDNSISSYDVQRAGSPLHDTLSIITTTDANNNPIVLHSINGGLTWTSVNVSNVTVYEGDPSQEIISGIGQQTFNEEYWTTYTWVGMPCHNTGKWIVELNKTIRGISADLDLLMSFRKLKAYSMDYVTNVTKTKACNYDILNKKANLKLLSDDVVLTITKPHSYLVGGMYKTPIRKGCNIDTVNALRLIKTLSTDLDIIKSVRTFANMRMNTLGAVQKPCDFDVHLVHDHVNEIMVSVERYSPQFPDIRYPSISYDVFDSRTQKVT